MANTKISFLKFGENTYQINDKEALHSLSTASADTLGGIKIFGTTTATITSGSSNNYGVQLDNNNKAYVHVPLISYYSGDGIDFDSNDARFDLKPASSDEIGGIAIGFDNSNDQNQNYPVELEEGTNRAYVHVDWHDANTEYQIKINGVQQTNVSNSINTWTNIYAPTTSGTTGQILKSNGANTAPTWVDAKASTDTLGLIKVFGTTTATITSGNNKNYGVKLDSDGKAYVNVPWEYPSIATSSTAGRIKSVKSYTSSGGIAPSSDMINEITSTGNATNISGRYYGVQTLEDGTAFVNVPWTNPTYNVVSGGAPIDKAPGFGGTFSVPYISQSTSGQVSITDRTITMPSISEGTLADLQSKSSTAASTVGKVWSSKVLNDWMSDIVGVDLEAVISTTTQLEKIFEDNDKTTGIISQINTKVTRDTYSITTEPTATTIVVTNPTASVTNPTVNYTPPTFTHTAASLTTTLGQTDEANDTLVFSFSADSASLTNGSVSLSGGSVTISGGTYSTSLTGGSINLD